MSSEETNLDTADSQVAQANKQAKKPGVKFWLGGLIVVVLMALAFVFWKSQGPLVAGSKRTEATVSMEQRLDALEHPNGSQRVHRIVEVGPHGEGNNCPPWYLAAESYLYDGQRSTVMSFYPEPYQVVFVDELKPLQPNEPYILLGHPPEGWGIKPDQLSRAYIVYELVSSDCESGHEGHHH